MKKQIIYPDRCSKENSNCKSCEYRLFGCAVSRYHPKEVGLIGVLAICFGITMMLLSLCWMLFFYNLRWTQLSVIVFLGGAIGSAILAVYCLNYIDKEEIEEKEKNNTNTGVITKIEVTKVAKCKFYPFINKNPNKITCDISNAHPNECKYIDMHSNCHYEKIENSESNKVDNTTRAI